MTRQQKWIFYDSMSKTQSNPITLDEAQMALFKMRPRDWSRFYIWTQSWDCWQPLELFLKSDQRYFVTQFAIHPHDETAKYQTIRDVLEMGEQVDENTHNEITSTGTGTITNTKSFSSIVIDDGPPKHEPTLGKSNFDGDELSWANAKVSDLNFKKLADKMSYDKRAARLNLKIEILLMTQKGNIFRSTSKNISLTGSLLEDNIPFDYYGIVFDITIINRLATTAVNSRVTLKAVTVGDGLTQRLMFHDVTPTQKRNLQGLLQSYLDHKSDAAKKSS